MSPRHRLAVVAAALIASSVVIGIGGGGRRARQRDGSPQPRANLGPMASPNSLFAHDPYMGVACHLANSIACDRVGLAVWLRRPASVSATIAGAPLKLNDPHWSYVAQDAGRTLYVYAGFLQPAGLRTRLHVTPEAKTEMWFGSDAPSPLVRFRIDYGNGDVVVTQEHVWLSAGWG